MVCIKKKLVHFIRHENGFALFYSYGQRFLWKHRLVEIAPYFFELEKVELDRWTEDTFAAIARASGHTVEDVRELATGLIKGGLLVELPSPEEERSIENCPQLLKFWAMRVTSSPKLFGNMKLR